MSGLSLTHCKNCGEDLNLNPVYGSTGRRNRCRKCHNKFQMERYESTKLNRDTFRTIWICPKCEKEITDPKEIRWNGKYVKCCMECNREYERRQNKTPQEKLRNRLTGLRQKGITSLEQFEEMKRNQGNCCAICREEPQNGRELVVDHNHGTGEVRGLLCYACNSALGHLKDSPKLFMDAYDYLERTTWSKGLDKVRFYGKGRTATEEKENN